MVSLKDAGAIICTASKEDMAYVDSLDVNSPIVVYNRESEKYPCVGVDNEEIGVIAARKLLSDGCKNMLFISDNSDHFYLASRCSGFIKECERANMSVKTIFVNNNTIQMGKDCGARLEVGTEKTGVFTGSDYIAMGLLCGLVDRGVKIPEQVEVISTGTSDIDIHEADARKHVQRVTAGNASGLNDGAAAIILASGEAVEKYGLKPQVKLTGWGQGGVDPKIMGVGPVPACRQAMKKAGVTIEDIDLIEANEAFAAQCVAVGRELDFDLKKVNVNGGAIALGHPIGCSGARIMVTLIHEMLKREDAKRGMATLCIGGGMATAVVVEKV